MTPVEVVAGRLSGTRKTRHGTFFAVCPRCDRKDGVLLGNTDDGAAVVVDVHCSCPKDTAVRDAIAAELDGAQIELRTSHEEIKRKEALREKEEREERRREREAKARAKAEERREAKQRPALSERKAADPEPEDRTTARPKQQAGAPEVVDPALDGAPNEATTAAEITRLAKLSHIAYQRERAAAAKALKLPGGTLDRFVAIARKESTNGHSTLPEIVPWPGPVDGVQLLDDLAAAYKLHVGLPTRAEDAAALWTLHAHCHDAAETSPRFGITSATPECGKSTLLRLVGDLVPRKLTASNITAAATFRSIEKWRPTLLIDEADTFLRDNDELRGVLNSGHSRAEAFVVRTVGDNHEPTLFDTWCPVVIAMIGSLPATLASRSVHIELERLPKGERVVPYRRAGPYVDLARKCARWALDNLEQLRDADPDLQGIINRAADNWRPLVAIADRAGGWWGGPTGKAREAAFTLNHVEAGQTIAVMLLDDIRRILTETGEDDRIASAEIADKLRAMEGRPWPEYGKQRKPISTNQIANLLRPFRVAPTKIHFPHLEGSQQGYWVSALAALFDRYLPSLSSDTPSEPEDRK